MELHGQYRVLQVLPINFFCEVVKVVRLETHLSYIGEVKSILVRDDVTTDNPLKWYPYPDIVKNKKMRNRNESLSEACPEFPSLHNGHLTLGT